MRRWPGLALRLAPALALGWLLAPAQAVAQSCPSGTAAATFDWSTSPGTGNEWTIANNTTGASEIYTVAYTDAYGNPNTLDVTVTLQDPDGMNYDDNFSCPAALSNGCDNPTTTKTETNGAFGSGFLTVKMASVNSVSDTIGFDFTFSKSVILNDFSLGDIDDVGFGAQAPEPEESFQDQLTFSASDGGSNVPLTLSGGSNMTVSGQTATAIVAPGVNGNLSPGDAAGTLTVSSGAAFDTLNFTYNNGPDDATNESGTGESNGHAVRLSGFALCVEDVPPALSIVKTASPSGSVQPGETITYTIEVTNSGPGNVNDVVVTDTLPTGVTYVAQSTAATGPVDSSATISDDFSSGDGTGGTGWSGNWTFNSSSIETTSPGGLSNAVFMNGGSSGTASRSADLSAYTSATLSFTWECNDTSSGWESSDFLDVQVSTNGGGTFSTVFSRDGTQVCPEEDDNQSGTESVSITAGNASTVIRLRSGTTSSSEDVYFDNIVIEAHGASGTTTKDNVPGGTNMDLVDGTPPSLVESGDGFTLAPGETLTVTFQVLVDDPLDPAITELTNTAEASATGIDPISDDAVNPVGADVAVTKTLITAGPYVSGQTVTYSMVVTNNGPSLATNVLVTDVASNLTITSVSSASCGALPCTIPSLASGASEVITVIATIDASGPFDNVVTVSADEADQDTSNNSDSDGDVAGNPVARACEFDNVAYVTADNNDPNPGNNLDTIGNGGSTCSAIEGTVWLDTDGDGVHDIGEPGIDGVTVYLCEASEPVCDASTAIATAVTDAAGDYSFPDLSAGDYQTQVEPAELTGGDLDGLEESPGNVAGNSGTLTLAAGETETADFGYVPDSGTAVIEGTVWSDADQDGIQDPGEVGIAGVTVQLLNPDGTPVLDSGGQPITAVTGPDGSYLLTDVPPGEYIVVVDTTDPELVAFCSPDPVAGCETSPTQSDPISVLENDIISDVDFGFDTSTSYEVSDAVWYDADGDGVLDPGEEMIPGVTVDLVDCGADGICGGANAADDTTIATAITDENGEVSFTGVTDGVYQLQVTDTASELDGFTETTATGGVEDVVVSGGDVLNAPSDGGTPSFGYNEPDTLSGTVWSDADGDGVHDPEEAGIEGVPIYLCTDPASPCDPSSPNFVAQTTTAADGSYSFGDLAPDNYVVTVGAAPSGSQTGDPDESGTCTVCDGTTTTAVTLNAGESVTGIEYGYQDTSLADVFGTVFNDTDTDGIQDGTEAGIGGVTLELLDDTGAVIATTVTDSNGDYSFPDLPDGDYTVVVTDTDNVLDGYTLTSGLDALDVTLAGSDIDDVDFGYVQDTGTASIGDTVFLDTNGDGVQGPDESGISGVQVDLYDAGPDGIVGTADDVFVGSTTTNANGQYDFGGLDSGIYYVDVPTAPTGLTSSTGGDTTTAIALSDGEDYNDADFGYVPTAGTATIGDTVWYDADGDGIQDEGEVGIGGIDILIQGPSCPTGCTVTTNPDGTWLATGLLPGDYIVTVDSAGIAALGYTTTPTNNGGDDTYLLTLADGDVVPTLDFGYDGGVVNTIEGTIWNDGDNDGVEGGSEGGIVGVTVNLVDGSGNIIATTTTDANGDYEFTGVPDGTYTVEVTDVDSVLVGLQQTGDPDESGTCSTCDEETSVSVAGGSTATADFGYGPEAGLGSIGNLVWFDTNLDGVYQVGEPPISGVTLECWHDVNGNGILDIDGTDNLIRTETTDEAGEYYCEGIPSGDYIARLTDEYGVTAGLTATVLGPNPGQDDNNQTNPYALTLNSSNFTADFGFVLPTGALSISGTVFEDGDANGSFAGTGLEPVVPSVTVYLYQDLDGDGVIDPDDPLVATTVTAIDGTYSFDNLPPGDYLVYADSEGTLVDGFVQTTQAGTGGVQPVTLVSSNVTDQDFGFWNGGVTTTPVTLAYFEAHGRGSVDFRWMTSTEVGNLGFNLYALEDDGLRRLNDELIPSHVVDSLEPQVYEFSAAGVAGDTFLLEDVDINGVIRHHGPFYADEAAGSEVVSAQPVAWAKIRDAKARRKAGKAARRNAGVLPEAGSADLGGAIEFGGRALRSNGGSSGSNSGRPGRGDELATFKVSEAGIYRVTYEDLAAAGVRLQGIRGDWLSLASGGEPVPFWVSGEGPFGPGSSLEFVGEPVDDSLYTRTNVYRLSVNRDRALRAEIEPYSGAGAAEPYYLETHKVEVERQYNFASPTGDPWYDRRLLATTKPVETSVTFDLDNWLPGAADVALEVSAYGVTNLPQAPDHHLVVEVNGGLVAEEWFDGLYQPEISAVLSDALLAPAGNTMRLLLPHDTGAQFDLVNYDHLTVRYPRDFVARADALSFASGGRSFLVRGFASTDVVAYGRTAGTLARLEAATVADGLGGYAAAFSGLGAADAEYWTVGAGSIRVPAIEAARAASDLGDAPADVLVIAHADFLDGLGRWESRRRGEGLAVRTVDVDDVYAAYSNGIVDPEAIRSYVRDAYKSLGTRYLLLVGGDTYDYFDHLGVGSMSFVPTPYLQTDAIVRYAPVDPLYGDVDGDLIPEVAVGRWPVRTLDELAAVIDKTLLYDGGELTAVLAADKRDAPTGFSFGQKSDAMGALLGSDWSLERVYLDEMPLTDAREALVREIGQGPAITSYFGHSGLTVWSFSGLFRSSDVDRLENRGKPTVVTQWGCWNTYHVLPTYETLGNRLLLEADTGAAAVLGAATLTEALSEQRLGRRVFDRLASPGARLGGAVVEAKRDLAESDPGRLDVILGWTLLGDPTMTIVP